LAIFLFVLIKQKNFLFNVTLFNKSKYSGMEQMNLGAQRKSSETFHINLLLLASKFVKGKINKRRTQNELF